MNVKELKGKEIKIIDYSTITDYENEEIVNSLIIEVNENKFMLSAHSFDIACLQLGEVVE